VLLGQKGQETLQVAAIVVVGERSSFADAPEYDGFPSGDLDQPEWFAGSPIVALELLGESVLERMVTRLQSAGTQSVSVVTKENRIHIITSSSNCPVESVLIEQPAGTWPTVAKLVDDYATNGFDTVLLIRLGAYLEFDFHDFLQFHRDQGQAVTRASASDGPLDFWMIDAKHFREAGVCFHEEKCTAVKAGAQHYRGAAYVNRLLHATDIRRLVADTLEMRLAIRPAGKEIKPGLWAHSSSRINPYARIEGPVYIGREARIGVTSFISALSNIERHSHIDRGTSVADASILAHTNLGAWLDVSKAVVSGKRLANLRHNVTVDILDDKLIKNTSAGIVDRPHVPSSAKPAGRPELVADVLKPQRSMIRAARAWFLARRA